MESRDGEVVELFFSCLDTDSRVTIQYKAIRIEIGIFENNLRDSDTKSQYVRFIQAANSDGTDELTIDDFYDWILTGCGPIYSQSTQQPVLPDRPTLDDYIHAKTYSFILHASEEERFILTPAKNGLDTRAFDHVDNLSEMWSLWPWFQPSQISICADSPQEALSRTPWKVCTPDGAMFFYKKHYPIDSDIIRRELQRYAEIRQAKLTDVRIPQLHGLVHDEAGFIIGLLLTYIDAGSTLGCSLRPETPSHIREKWSKQITETVKRMHDAGVVWGDVKPDNILVDRDGDLWVIDFGGGYTPGWVEKDLAETIAGDEQGLSRILEHIRDC